MMYIFNYFFELLPIALAIGAIITCSHAYSNVRRRRKQDKLSMLLGIICASLMVIAQTSWWATKILQGSLEGTYFANLIWTIFNSLVMWLIIYISLSFSRQK